jgi:hypothetical protein
MTAIVISPDQEIYKPFPKLHRGAFTNGQVTIEMTTETDGGLPGPLVNRSKCISVESRLATLFPIKGNPVYSFFYRSVYIGNFCHDFVSNVSVKKNLMIPSSFD